MKIDEGCINHNAMRIINALVEWIHDAVFEEKDNAKAFCETLGEIRGVVLLANELKKVIKC